MNVYSDSSAYAGHVVPGIRDFTKTGASVDPFLNTIPTLPKEDEVLKPVEDKKAILEKLQTMVKDEMKPTTEALPQHRDWR